MKFDLKKPCKQCPFIKGTTMALSPGRMEGIVESLRSDYNVFPCHKTAQHDEDEEGNSITVPHENEQACMGALAYAYQHHGVTPVLARLAISRGETNLKLIAHTIDRLEEPGKWPTY